MWRWFVVGMAILWALPVLSACGGGAASFGSGSETNPLSTTAAPAQHQTVIATREFVFGFQIDVPGQLTAYTSGDMQTHGMLYDTTLAPPAELARDQTSGDGENFRIVTGLAAGTYDLAIVASGDVMLPYTLSVLFEPAPTR